MTGEVSTFPSITHRSAVLQAAAAWNRGLTADRDFSAARYDCGVVCDIVANIDGVDLTGLYTTLIYGLSLSSL